MVWWAVSAMVNAGATSCTVTIPAGYEDEFADALTGLPVRLVVGGETRQRSVKLALDESNPAHQDVVLVHDAARALIPVPVIRRVVDAVVAGADAVLPGVPVSDSLRRATPIGTEPVERADLWHVQTPQGFRASTLVEAHEWAAAQGVEVTDDASAAELIGASVVIVAGDREALKITDAFDLRVANELAKSGA